MLRFFIFIFCFPILSFSFSCDSITISNISNPGPYSVISYDEPSGIRNGVYYDGSTIYCPVNGTNLSSIVLVPGFMNTEFTIQNWGPFLASYGIVTMTIGTNSLADDEFDRRDALQDAIISLKEENTRFLSPIFGRIDLNSISVGGFSKGGGGAQLLAKIDSSLKSVVSLYPFIENPVASDFNHGIPTIIISGQLDIIAPPALHADIHYDYIPITTNKLKFEVALGSHDALLGPNGASGEVGVRVLSWLANYMLNDNCYCPLIKTIPTFSSQYLNNINCGLSTTHEISNFSNLNTKRVFDLFGRISKVKSNHLLFYQNSDGIISKKLIIE